MNVTLLIDATGEVCSVWADKSKAALKAAEFNADPFLEPGLPDPAVPYRIKEWGVTGADGINPIGSN